MNQKLAFQEFKGPMEALILQVQQKEIELFDVNLTQLARDFKQAAEKDLQEGAKFIAGLSHLMFLKALRLVPVNDTALPLEEVEKNFERNLEEYSLFKEVARSFSAKEGEQAKRYWRQLTFEFFAAYEPPVQPKLPPPMPLEEFSRLFSKILANAQKRNVQISEDVYKITDLLDELRGKLKKSRLSFDALFYSHTNKLLLIVTFLAVLEMLKNQEAILYMEQSILFLEKATDV